MNKRQRGNSILVVLFAIAVILVAVVIYLVKTKKPVEDMFFVEEQEVVVDKEPFEELEENKSTPKEINDEVLGELDLLIDSIEDESDLSDLDF
ncbi:hypothetical protein ACFL13_02000 [Patescibacteria group bacterium]